MNFAAHDALLGRPHELFGLQLLPERAVFHPPSGDLFVADVHLGKAATFRALGVPAPAGTTQVNLDRLAALIAGYRARRLVVLGDFIHSRHAHTRALSETLAAWRERHAHVRMTLIEGNHDKGARQLLAGLDIEISTDALDFGYVTGKHHPDAVDGAVDASAIPTLSGHLHPVVSLRGPGRDRLRVACFLVQNRQIVLPSFGEFTGGHAVNRMFASQILAVAENRIVRVR